MTNYAAPPARRVAFDRDNMQVTTWRTDKSGVAEVSEAALNDEDEDTVDLLQGLGTLLTAGGSSAYLCFLPAAGFKLLDIKIMFGATFGGAASIVTDIERSDDTTNGRDGTWTTQSSGVAESVNEPSRPFYREDIIAVGTGAAHIGYRIKATVSGGSGITALTMRVVHLYGVEYGGANRLGFWDPTLDQEYAPDIDFGDVARGVAYTKTFRVKNLAATQANDIDLTVEQGPSHGSPSGWTLLSLDDITYAQTINIGNLGAGVISSLLYLKADIPTNAELNTLSLRITPTVASYS